MKTLRLPQGTPMQNSVHPKPMPLFAVSINSCPLFNSHLQDVPILVWQKLSDARVTDENDASAKANDSRPGSHSQCASSFTSNNLGVRRSVST